MEIAIIQNYSPRHFEVWITDFIKTDEGMGDVFDTHEEALTYASENDVPVLDLSDTVTPLLE